MRPLAGAYANDFASVAPLFAGDPADPAAWRDTIRRVTAAKHDRGALASILKSQLDRRDAPVEAKRAAAEFVNPATVAVITGQQAAIFGGPLYTLLKAITAIRVARDITRDYGVPAVPVFWVDAEDHDWDEVRTCTILDKDARLHEISLAPPAGAGEQPVGSLALGPDIASILETLGTALSPTEFTSDLIDQLKRCYQPGIAMGAAFAAWLDHLLGRYGLVVYESNDVAAKKLAVGIFTHELEQPSRSAELVRTASDVMRKLGHAPQVEPAEDAVSLFYVDGAGRRSIKRDGAGYRVGDDVKTVDAIRAEATAHPERFSPNVLLRPLVQDQIFPTICYVGGPAELAYQAELGGVYRDFGVEVPLLYPRLTATLVDSAAARFLERSNLPFESLQPQDDAALNALLEQFLPPVIDESIDGAKRELAMRLATLKEAIPAVDPTLAGTVDTTMTKVEDALKTLHAKIIQASKRKDDTLRRQFTHARDLAFPGGHPQERAINIVFFVNRYGSALCDQLLESVPLDMSKHYIINI